MAKFWLMKTEPKTYSWDDLNAAEEATDCWDGIRNYQARNYMREMQEGDQVFIYHSQVQPAAIMGIARVARTAYPDPTQFDPGSKYFDPKSTHENPRWDMVDVQAIFDFDRPITLPELRQVPGLEEMVLLRRGMRLSIQPVTPEEWKTILSMRKIIPLR